MPKQPTIDDGGRQPPISTRWGRYIETLMDSLGWNNVTLSRRSGVDRSLIGRWRNDGTEPSIESVRVVAKAFGVDIREALVEAEIFSEEEMRIRSIAPDIRTIPDDALLDEIRRRMRTGRTKVISRVADTTDLAETEEASGVDEVGESTDTDTQTVTLVDHGYLAAVDSVSAVIALDAVDPQPKPKARGRRVQQSE